MSNIKNSFCLFLQGQVWNHLEERSHDSQRKVPFNLDDQLSPIHPFPQGLSPFPFPKRHSLS